MSLRPYAVAAPLLPAWLALQPSPPARAEARTGALRIAAAADLAPAFKELGARFEARAGQRLLFTFGSTGLLAQQLAQRAPFDVFAAADVGFVDQVIKAGACDPSSKAVYARGRLVVWSRPGGVPPPSSLAELADARFVKVAIANPAHAPYGRAAAQALRQAGLWPQIGDRLVFGENVQQAMQYARSGNAEVAIVALSLALATPGTLLEVDPALHAPLDQALAVCGDDPTRRAAARRFVVFVSSAEGRAIMSRHGFRLPPVDAP